MHVSRGETHPKVERSRSWAIGVAFGVLALAALTFVVQMTGVVEHFRLPWLAPAVARNEPIPGLFGTLDAALWIGTGRFGPTMPGAGPESATGLAHALSSRGFVEQAGPLPRSSIGASLPTDRCGVLLAPEGPSGPGWGARLSVLCDRADTSPAIDTSASADDEVQYFALPGVTNAAPAETGLPPAILMRMAVVEGALAPLGYLPSDRYVRLHLDPPSGTSPRSAEHTVAAPATPASGCVVWTAYSEEFGGATSYFEASVVSGSTSDELDGPDGISAWFVSCAPLGPPVGGNELRLEDPRRRGGDVYLRAFEIPTSGPHVPRPSATTVGALREVAEADLSLPAGAPRVEP